MEVAPLREVNTGAAGSAIVEASTPAYDPRGYWERRLRKSFDLTGAGYSKMGRPFNEALYRQRRIVLVRALRRFDIRPAGSAVLELGPGTGFYVPLWKRFGVRHLTGLDVAPVSVHRLGKRYPEFVFREADITRSWEVADGGFDIVTAFDVLFHVVDDAGFATAISEAARVLGKGGHLLVADFFLHGEPLTTFHQSIRRLTDYEQELTRHGFRVLGRLPIFVAMHPPIDVPPGRRRDLAARWWAWLQARVRADPHGAPRLASAVGMFDRVATRVVRDGPSMELLVARR